MNVTFTEEDGTVRRWDGFKPGRLMSTEAEAIEKVTGLTFAQWGQSLMNGSAVAGRALVWILKRRDLAGDERKAFRFGKVDFPVEDLVVGLDADERQLALEALEKDTDLSDEDRDQLRFAIQASAEVDEMTSDPDEDGPGNALVQPAAESTPG